MPKAPNHLVTIGSKPEDEHPNTINLDKEPPDEPEKARPPTPETHRKFWKYQRAYLNEAQVVWPIFFRDGSIVIRGAYWEATDRYSLYRQNFITYKAHVFDKKILKPEEVDPNLKYKANARNQPIQWQYNLRPRRDWDFERSFTPRQTFDLAPFSINSYKEAWTAWRDFTKICNFIIPIIDNTRGGFFVSLVTRRKTPLVGGEEPNKRNIIPTIYIVHPEPKAIYKMLMELETDLRIEIRRGVTERIVNIKGNNEGCKGWGEYTQRIGVGNSISLQGCGGQTVTMGGWLMMVSKLENGGFKVQRLGVTVGQPIIQHILDPSYRHGLPVRAHGNLELLNDLHKYHRGRGKVLGGGINHNTPGEICNDGYYMVINQIVQPSEGDRKKNSADLEKRLTEVVEFHNNFYAENSEKRGALEALERLNEFSDEDKKVIAQLEAKIAEDEERGECWAGSVFTAVFDMPEMKHREKWPLSRWVQERNGTRSIKDYSLLEIDEDRRGPSAFQNPVTGRKHPIRGHLSIEELPEKPLFKVNSGGEQCIPCQVNPVKALVKLHGCSSITEEFFAIRTRSRNHGPDFQATRPATHGGLTTSDFAQKGDSGAFLIEAPKDGRGRGRGDEVRVAAMMVAAAVVDTRFCGREGRAAEIAIVTPAEKLVKYIGGDLGVRVDFGGEFNGSEKGYYDDVEDDEDFQMPE